MGLISTTSFIAVAVLAWFWFRRYLNAWWCAIFAGLIIVGPPIFAISRLATPDSLELAVIAIALYLLLETSRTVLGSALLLLAIWVRPDALILVGMLLCMLFFLRRIDFTEWATFSVLALVSYFLIQISAGSYSWSVLFHNSFSAPLTEPRNAIVHISARNYFVTLAQNGWNLSKSSSLALILLSGVIALLLHRCPSYRYITGAVLVFLMVHFLLYPSVEYRFYALPSLFFPLSLVLACSSHFQTTATARTPISTASVRPPVSELR